MTNRHRAHTRLLAPLLATLALAVVAAACSPQAEPAQLDPSPTRDTYVPGTAKDGPVPTATPTPSPTATSTTIVEPTATPTPSAGPSMLIEHGDRASIQVALTFDMGGRVEPALDIMQFLIDNGVHATIFMTGAMAENQNTEAGRDVLRLVAGHPDLFALGNHSYSHADFRELTDTEIRAELNDTETAIAAAVPLDPRPWFRPPFGAQDDRIRAILGEEGYAFTVNWDIDTIDWRPEEDGGPTATDITAKVLDNAAGGSIVLMHLGGFNTLDALPAMVSGLRAAGFELVRLDELEGF